MPTPGPLCSRWTPVNPMLLWLRNFGLSIDFVLATTVSMHKYLFVKLPPCAHTHTHTHTHTRTHTHARTHTRLSPCGTASLHWRGRTVPVQIYYSAISLRLAPVKNFMLHKRCSGKYSIIGTTAYITHLSLPPGTAAEHSPQPRREKDLHDDHGAAVLVMLGQVRLSFTS